MHFKNLFDIKKTIIGNIPEAGMGKSPLLLLNANSAGKFIDESEIKHTEPTSCLRKIAPYGAE